VLRDLGEVDIGKRVSRFLDCQIASRNLSNSWTAVGWDKGAGLRLLEADRPLEILSVGVAGVDDDGGVSSADIRGDELIIHRLKSR